MEAGRNGQGQPLELSLCMIVRDEEPRLRECLESIRPWVDEMIVVDTGSQDRTREVAAACGARVYEMPWPESFAAARNESLAQARGRWIYWMDADDVIAPECGRALRQLVRSRPEADAAFMVGVEIPPGPGEFSPSVVDHVKLFPNRPELRFEHRIHEQILTAIRAADLEVVATPLRVTHRNYDRSDAGQAKKRARDFRLLELDLQERPEHPFVLFNLGMTYLYAAKEYEVAAHYLQRSLARSDPSDSIVRKAYAMLATARICQGEWEAAIQANEEGRGHYPDDAELLFQAGQLYQQVGQFAEGRLALERLLEGNEGEHYRSVDVGLRTYRGRHELALLYRRMGDAPHCARVLREIAATEPEYLPAQVDLVETLHALGKFAEGYTFLSTLPPVPGLADELERLRALDWHGVEAAAPRLAEAGENEADPRHFRFRGERYPYFVHPYNGAGSNERTVEVALALAALQAHRDRGPEAGPILEVGHVLGHYGIHGHVVVDKYEPAPGVLNVDIAEYCPGERYGLILSLSTLEHVGVDEPEPDPEKAVRVLQRLREDLLLPGGRLLLTVPLGYNAALDALLHSGDTGLKAGYLQRVNAENEWREAGPEAARAARYGYPYSQGNVLAVLSTAA